MDRGWEGGGGAAFLHRPGFLPHAEISWNLPPPGNFPSSLLSLPALARNQPSLDLLYSSPPSLPPALPRHLGRRHLPLPPPVVLLPPAGSFPHVFRLLARDFSLPFPPSFPPSVPPDREPELARHRHGDRDLCLHRLHLVTAVEEKLFFHRRGEIHGPSLRAPLQEYPRASVREGGREEKYLSWGGAGRQVVGERGETLQYRVCMYCVLRMRAGECTFSACASSRSLPRLLSLFPNPFSPSLAASPPPWLPPVLSRRSPALFSPCFSAFPAGVGS